MSPLVALEIHDVAPSTWSRCVRLLDMLARIGAPRVTLLVVPWYHREIAIDRAPQFTRAISKRIARGDEAALHGYVHLDEAPPPRTLRGFVERRVLTRSEGEFAAIDAQRSREAIASAVAIWRRVGWPIGGFVPPAWALGIDARAALTHARPPFAYVALRGSLYRLPQWRRVTTDLLCYSPTSAPRRLMSRAAIALAMTRASNTRLLRIALHPQDADVPQVLEHWQQIIARVLSVRVPVTTQAALELIAPASATVVPIREVNASTRPARAANARARGGSRSGAD